MYLIYKAIFTFQYGPTLISVSKINNLGSSSFTFQYGSTLILANKYRKTKKSEFTFQYGSTLINYLHKM